MYWPCCKTHNCNFGCYYRSTAKESFKKRLSHDSARSFQVKATFVVFGRVSTSVCLPFITSAEDVATRRHAGCATTTKTELQKQQINGRQTKRQTHRADYGKNGKKGQIKQPKKKLSDFKDGEIVFDSTGEFRAIITRITGAAKLSGHLRITWIIAIIYLFAPEVHFTQSGQCAQSREPRRSWHGRQSAATSSEGENRLRRNRHVP